MEVHRVSYLDTLSLRHRILRPNFDLADCEYPGDADSTTSHFSLMENGQQLGIVSLYQVSHKNNVNQQGFQIRAMATVEHVRGQGIGRRLLAAAEQAAWQQGGDYIWANGRTSALGFYESNGYQVLGEPFDIPNVGPHKLVWKSAKQID